MLEIFHIQIIFLVTNFIVTAFSALFPVLFVWWKSKYRNEDQVRYQILLRVGSNVKDYNFLNDTLILSDFQSEGKSYDSAKPQKKLTKDLQLSKRTKICLKFANSFGCGVFLAMCIINLVPASSSSWKKILESKKSESMNEMHESAETGLQIFPWSEFLTLVGFTIILVIEIFHGNHNKKEVSRPSKGNTTAGKIYSLKADIADVKNVVVKYFFIDNCYFVQNSSCFGGGKGINAFKTNDFPRETSSTNYIHLLY